MNINIRLKPAHDTINIQTKPNLIFRNIFIYGDKIEPKSSKHVNDILYV